MFGRNTEWRQGHLLTDEATIRLELAESPDERAIIISHDCDIPAEAEKYVEVIVARIKGSSNPQLEFGKNPRTLHLSAKDQDGSSITIELCHKDRHAVCKQKFAQLVSESERVTLPAESKRVLKQWLAARYGRPAFPNEFERRLCKRSGKRELKSRINKILEPHAKHIFALFFGLGDQRFSEEPIGEPYALSIYIVYDVSGLEEARLSAEECAQKLRELFIKIYGPPEEATEILLAECEAIDDESITLAALRGLDQWRLEYISMSDDENGEFLEVGKMPV